MEIEIQNWWNAKIRTPPSSAKLNPETIIKECGDIIICEVIIDGKIVGSVTWNGRRLGISEVLVEKKNCSRPSACSKYLINRSL